MNSYKKIVLPDNLSEEAENYIKKVIDYLKKNDKLSEIDAGALYILADSYNTYLKASKTIDKEGMTVEGSRGTRVVHPCVRISKDNRTLCLQIMESMGMTLKSRAKMNANDNEEDSPLTQFLKNN